MRRVVAIAALVALSFLLPLACNKPDETKLPPAPVAISVVVSADTAGWLTPCGCTSNQSGGMARRASYLAGLRDAGTPVLYADAGGAAGGVGDYHRARFEAILVAELKLGLAAHNVGKSEAAFGAAYLREVAGRLSAPFVSANLTDAGGQPVVPPVRLATLGGRRVAFVGVLSPKLVAGDLKASEPKEAILAAAKTVAGRYDSLVVLAYLPQQDLEALAALLPEADAVVGGPTGQSIAPRKIGPTLLAASTNKGKFVVRLTADPAAGWGGSVVEMAPSFPDHADLAPILASYLADLGSRDLPASGTNLVPPVPAGAPADFRVAGSASCAACHPAETAVWATSKHNHAWDTIKAKGFHVDSSCQQCHTTGFAMPGGFETRRLGEKLVNVGCESCHGPSQAHVNSPNVRTPYVAADQCVRCHDHENSPAFEFNTYWARTRHGKGTSPDPATKPAGHP